MRTKVQTANSEALETTLYGRMVEASPQAITAMKKKIADAVEALREIKLAEGELSKDFRYCTEWNDTDAVARFFIALGISPKVYLLNKYLPEAEVEKAGFALNARSCNLKAHKKLRETAEYILHGGKKLEDVVKTWTACAILASRHTSVIPRRVCEMFLTAIDIAQVSPDLAQAVEHYQAKHMSGGAPTQTSQMTLTLANLNAGSLVQDGRSKHFALNPESEVIAALAERFGMLDKLSA